MLFPYFLLQLCGLLLFDYISASIQESTMNKYIEIETYDALLPLIVPGAVLRHYAFQNIEFGRNAVQCR